MWRRTKFQTWLCLPDVNWGEILTHQNGGRVMRKEEGGQFYAVKTMGQKTARPMGLYLMIDVFSWFCDVGFRMPSVCLLSRILIDCPMGTAFQERVLSYTAVIWTKGRSKTVPERSKEQILLRVACCIESSVWRP